jgi:cyclopropane fatty-acyl-phospholipid synthase-like methyltransferase
MEWFNTWFNTPYYHLLYQDRDYKEGEDFLVKLIEDLNLKPNSKIIDLACGKGRHSVFLNKMGFDVLGLDLSEENIKHNKKRENETLKFKIHDMRNHIVSEKMEAVFNLFTSFGYFKTDEEDQNVFNSVSEILNKNGIFVLDFMNSDFIKHHLKAHQKVTRSDIEFTITKKIENEHVIKEISFQDKGQDFKFEENVKLHSLNSIQNFAKKVGLERIKLWGDYQLNDFDEKISPRCINVFKKI